MRGGVNVLDSEAKHFSNGKVLPSPFLVPLVDETFFPNQSRSAKLTKAKGRKK